MDAHLTDYMHLHLCFDSMSWKSKDFTQWEKNLVF